MKTTIDIADPVLKRAKKLAAERGTTLKVLVDTALRDLLAASRSRTRPHRLQTHTFEGEGLQPGLSWDDWAAIREMSYEGRGG
ncbi:MAG: DUF2191 domain-containing protein [Candidatus Riflebacteria bacterium]|nr:DUF2191 domain-containing protein [Candidatus Riflebacteria bacterium]